MPLKLIFILLCSVEIYADFWCSNETLHKLIQCLISTNIKYDQDLTDLETAIRRFNCAEKSFCTRKPWNMWALKMRLLDKYYWCMNHARNVPTSLADQLNEEYQCRWELANSLPEDLRFYYDFLVPPKPKQD